MQTAGSHRAGLCQHWAQPFSKVIEISNVTEDNNVKAGRRRGKIGSPCMVVTEDRLSVDAFAADVESNVKPRIIHIPHHDPFRHAVLQALQSFKLP